MSMSGRDSSDDFFNGALGSPPAKSAPRARRTAGTGSNGSGLQQRRPPPPPPPRASMSTNTAPRARNTSVPSYAKTTAASSSRMMAPPAARPNPSQPNAPAPAPAPTNDWYTPSATSNTSSLTSISQTPAAAAPVVMNPYASTNSQKNFQTDRSSNFGSLNASNYGQSNIMQPSMIQPQPQPQPSVMQPAVMQPMDPGSTTVSSSSGMMGPMSGSMTPTPAAPGPGNMTGAYYGTNDEIEDEPPLMEELGINLDHIGSKSKAVLLPFTRFGSHMDASTIVQDSDLAGPLAFALLLGGELMMSGCLRFGYIYGFGLFGCLAMTLVLNLLSPQEAVSIWTVASILGYSLLPVNLLAGINILLRLKHYSFGMVLAILVILWCTVASTRLFEHGINMRDQRYLVAYPIALLYVAFVIITIF